MEGCTVFLNAVRNFVNELFAGKEPWQIASITASTVLFSVYTWNFLNEDESINTRAKKAFHRILRKIPAVKLRIANEMKTVQENFQNDVENRLVGRHTNFVLPSKGLPMEEILEEVTTLLELGSFNWRNGQVSGAIYHLSEDIAKVASAAYTITAYSNPLHTDIFPGINKMEAEVVKMSVNLFHGDEDACGTMTTGGTESILLACKAFRDRAYSMGIEKPEMIVPKTAHSAFDKAAQYLGIIVRTIPVDTENYAVDVKAMRRAINRRTCLIVGSAPNFPYGTFDDISKLSELAVKYKVPLHVDGCLGGWLAAFMPLAGFDLPPFDFKLPGVASISADTHKYGYAPKGSSVILYRKHEYRHFQYTVTTDWPGGVYGSPTVGGSRAGGIIAAAWATMMFLGKDRYIQITGDIVTTARFIEHKLRQVDGIFIFGNPATSVIALGSKIFDIYRLADALHKKKWSLNTLQFPSGIHFAVTAVHTKPGIAERFVKDVSDEVAIIMKNPEKPVEGRMVLYGVAQSLGDRTLVGDITKHFVDSMYYLPKSQSHITSAEDLEDSNSNSVKYMN